MRVYVVIEWWEDGAEVKSVWSSERAALLEADRLRERHIYCTVLDIEVDRGWGE